MAEIGLSSASSAMRLSFNTWRVYFLRRSSFLRMPPLLSSILRQIRHKIKKCGINNRTDRKSTRLNSSHVKKSYAVFCLKKKRHIDRIKLHKNESSAQKVEKDCADRDDI